MTWNVAFHLTVLPSLLALRLGPQNTESFAVKPASAYSEDLMRVAATISRYFLGFIFFVFGLNGFLHFIPQPPMPPSLALQFMTVMVASHYFVVVFLVQLIGGILLLVNRFVPLALTLLGSVIVNILNFHILMNPGGIGPVLLATILWIVVFLSVRPAFDGILRPMVSPVEM